jgi:uncharacterized protein (TIGR00266 family)
MEHRIHGTTMPVLEMDLQPGESIISEAGELSWMTSEIELSTSTQFGGGGGVFGAFKRAAGGNSLFMNQYTAKGGPGSVAFAARLPGTIHPVEVRNGAEFMIHRHGFLCGTPAIQISIGFQQSLGAGVFGGEGFRLTRLSGDGTAFVELSGEVVTYDLDRGETLRVHPGHVGMFERSVSFEITRIKGIKNMIFGADGIFLAALTGPGKVWLQSLTLSNLAHAIAPYLNVESAGSGAAAGAIAGGLLKGLTK